MQRGAKPTPAPLRLLRGNPGQRPLPAGNPQPLRLDRVPDPPEDVARSDYARSEWNRMAPELWRLNLLTIADVQPLGLYCTAYARWRDAEDALYAVAKDDPVFKGLVVDGAMGGKIANPLVKIASTAGLNLLRYAVEFGFTPSSRTRITGSAAADDPDRKFSGLLANQ
jgi:P27 family predicted phage terminase small subunit